MKLNKPWSLLLIASLVTLSACSQLAAAKPIAPQPNTSQPNTSQPMSSQPKVVQTQSIPHLPKKIDHIVIVIEENHSQHEIAGDPSAPFMNQLMKQGANLTNYHAIEHPSQPNYLDLFSGSNQGVTDDKIPKKKFSTANLGYELIKNHYTFAGYSESLPSVGFNGVTNSAGSGVKAGVYARKHNPWVNFTNIPSGANMPLSSFPKDFTKLPTVSFVIPNLANDMHDGSIKTADRWLQDHFDEYVQWAKIHNSLLLVTWDEDDFSQKNKVPTFLVGQMVRTGSYNENISHFNLLRTIEDIYGLAHVGKSDSVAPIRDIWK